MGGQKKYNREVAINIVFIENIIAARDCIVISCASTRWDWVIGSRHFFWRWSEECWLSRSGGHPK